MSIRNSFKLFFIIAFGLIALTMTLHPVKDFFAHLLLLDTTTGAPAVHAPSFVTTILPSALQAPSLVTTLLPSPLYNITAPIYITQPAATIPTPPPRLLYPASRISQYYETIDMVIYTCLIFLFIPIHKFSTHILAIGMVVSIGAPICFGMSLSCWSFVKCIPDALV